MVVHSAPLQPGLPRRASVARLKTGHALQLLLDAHTAWQRLLADLDAARGTVDVELYMLVEDAIGHAFVNRLCHVAERGVRVRLLLDAIGSLGLGTATRQQLQASGVALRLFHPPSLRPALALRTLPRPRAWLAHVRAWFRRDHRKAVVVDGEVAHVLGMNMGSQYFAARPEAPTWADAGVRVAGPVVAQLGAAFEHTWAEATATAAEPTAQPRVRQVPAATTERRQGRLAAIAFGSGEAGSDVHRRYVAAVRAATDRVWLAHSYFLPGPRLRRTLCHAAQRGVDVRVLLPALRQGDVVVVALAMDWAIGHLLERGVRVFLMDRRMLHAKLALCDGNWWTIGSANLDVLSRQHNLEANVVGVGHGEVAELSAWFEARCAEAHELTLADWQRRPWWRKALGRSAWTLRAYL